MNKTRILEKAKAFDIIVKKGVLTLWNNGDLEFPIRAFRLSNEEAELFKKFIPITLVFGDELKTPQTTKGIEFPRTPVVSPEEFKKIGSVSLDDDSININPNDRPIDMPLIHYNIIVDSDIVGGVIKQLIGFGYHNIEIKKHDSNSNKVFFTLRQ